MFIATLLKLYIVLFAFIVWHRFELGLFFLFLFLPAYLIRFKFVGLPSTLLEAMLEVIVLIFFGQLLANKNLKNTLLELKEKIKQQPSFFLAIFIFITAATISVFTSIDMRSALGEWKAFYIEPILIFIILITSIKEKPAKGGPALGWNNLIFALVLSGFFTAALAVYQKFTGWFVPWEFWENHNTYRVTGWYGFPNAVGLFIAPLVPLAIYLIKQNTSKIYTIISAIFIPLAALAIIFAKSTGSLIGLLAGLFILLLIWKKTRIASAALIIFGILGIIFMPNNSIKQELLMQDYSGQLRLNIWAETTEFLSDHPFTGAGLASYQTLIYPYRIDKWVEVFHHPHNIFLTMWVNLGLLGLAGFVWILVWFYRVALTIVIKKIKTEEFGLEVFLLSSMTVFVVAGLVDSPYIKNDLAILFWFLPALLFTTIENGARN